MTPSIPPLISTRTGLVSRGLSLFASQAVCLVALATPFLALSTLPEPSLPGMAIRITEIEETRTTSGPARHLYVERTHTTGTRTEVTIRAASALELHVSVTGGASGNELLWETSSPQPFREGEVRGYALPLSGPNPLVILAWQTPNGASRSLTLDKRQLGYPLPWITTEYCELIVTSLSWHQKGAIRGILEHDCPHPRRAVFDTLVETGHLGERSVDAYRTAAPRALQGQASVSIPGGRATSVTLNPEGATHFSVVPPPGMLVHPITIDASIATTLDVSMPANVETVHVPEETIYFENFCVKVPGCGYGPDTCTLYQTFSMTLPEKTVSTEQPEYQAERTSEQELRMLTSMFTDAPYTAAPTWEIPDWVGALMAPGDD